MNMILHGVNCQKLDIKQEDSLRGKEVRLLQGQSPQISPYGKRVLFVSSLSHEGSWRAKLRVKLLDLNSNLGRVVLLWFDAPGRTLRLLVQPLTPQPA